MKTKLIKKKWSTGYNSSGEIDILENNWKFAQIEFNPFNEKEMDINATLIVLAPKMLKALEKSVDLLKDGDIKSRKHAKYIGSLIKKIEKGVHYEII